MNEGLIPKRYAKALYKYAEGEKSTAEVYDEMKQLVESYVANAGLADAVDNPFMASSDKEKVLLSASGAQKGGSTDKFIKLVIKHNRENFMRAIALDYGEIYRENNHIARVNIAVASKLPDDKLTKIIEVVERQLKGKTIEKTVTIDPELIGGFVVKVDSMVLDTSIKNELKKLRLKLLSSKER